MAEHWPRLSETLPHRGELLRCWNCGCAAVNNDEGHLYRWQECDDRDQPERIILVLCRKCGEEIIEPHPRLYHQLRPYEPWAGAMGICADCVHRLGTDCTVRRPIELTQRPPYRAFIDYSGNGGRRGACVKVWPGPVTACDQKQTADA